MLADQTALVDLLVDSVVDYAIFALDPHGVIVSWNLGAERMKGWPPNEILGRHVSTFYSPEDIRAHKPSAELEAAESEGGFKGVGWRVRKDESRFLAEVAMTPLRDAQGNLVGFADVTRDLTPGNLAEGMSTARAVIAERERIGGELAWTAIHSLFAVGLSLQALNASLADEKTRDRLAKAVDDLDRVISELRSAIYRRHPQPVEEVRERRGARLWW